MQKGIFQGCPISPYLFLCMIEVATLAIRQNENIYGIFDDDVELKVSLLADDTIYFVDGSQNSFDSLLSTLDTSAEYSGCKINLSKSEAIWIGSKKGSNTFPLREKSLSWKMSSFKALGIVFHLNTKYMFDLIRLNYNKLSSLLIVGRARNL